MAAKVGGSHTEGMGKLSGAGAPPLLKVVQDSLPGGLHSMSIYENKYLRINKY